MLPFNAIPRRRLLLLLMMVVVVVVAAAGWRLAASLPSMMLSVRCCYLLLL
jgi:hypothetical protein